MVKTLLPEIESEEALRALAESIGDLFDRWGIKQVEQRRLLSMEKWAGFETESLPRDSLVLERAGHLLAIDRALQELEPESPKSVAWWIRTPQPMFSAEAPVAVMLTHGVVGMKKVRKILESGTKPAH